MLTHYEHGISAIDAQYMRPQLAAIHLIRHAGRAALVDTGTNHSVPQVLDALQQLGVARDAVDYIFLTHVHLDHAGGAGALLRELPHARLVVHPRGARHMIDPSKLSAATQAVYGVENARALYGTLVPAATERVIEVKDGDVLHLADRAFLFLDTPGHARHHVCIRDSLSECFFTGDTCGLFYREMCVSGADHVWPTLTPTQLEPSALHASVDRIMGYQPRGFFGTHYGLARDTGRLAQDIHRLIDAQINVALQHREAGSTRHAHILEGLRNLVRTEAQHWPLDADEALRVLDGDLELNTQGLEVWLDQGAKP